MMLSPGEEKLMTMGVRRTLPKLLRVTAISFAQPEPGHGLCLDLLDSLFLALDRILASLNVILALLQNLLARGNITGELVIADVQQIFAALQIGFPACQPRGSLAVFC